MPFYCQVHCGLSVFSMGMKIFISPTSYVSWFKTYYLYFLLAGGSQNISGSRTVFRLEHYFKGQNWNNYLFACKFFTVFPGKLLHLMPTNRIGAYDNSEMKKTSFVFAVSLFWEGWYCIFSSSPESSEINRAELGLSA